MRAPATPFFRDIRFSNSTRDAAAHERYMLDTMAERRAEEAPRGRFEAVLALFR